MEQIPTKISAYSLNNSIENLAINYKKVFELEQLLNINLTYYVKKMISLEDDIDYFKNPNPNIEFLTFAKIKESITEELITLITFNNICLCYNYINKDYLLLENNTILYRSNNIYEVLSKNETLINEIYKYYNQINNNTRNRTKELFNASHSKREFFNEKYGELFIDLNGWGYLNDNDITFDKYIPSLTISYYDPKHKEEYLYNIEKLYSDSKRILEFYYQKSLEACENWDEVDENGNEITLEYIKENIDITNIEIGIKYTVIWGILPHDIMGGHNLNLYYHNIDDTMDFRLEG